MNLSQAIQTIISDYGVDILKERRFVGLLSDYQAFEDLPFAKTILKQMYSSVYKIQLYEAYAAKDKTKINALKSIISDNLAYDPKKVKLLFGEFDTAFAISKKEEKDNLKDKGNTQTTNIESNTNNDNTSNTEDTTKPQNDNNGFNAIFIIFSPIIAILLNVGVYLISPYWLFLEIPISMCFVLFSFSRISERKATFNIVLLVLLFLEFLTIVTPLPWWCVLITCIVFVASGIIDLFIRYYYESKQSHNPNH